MLPIDHGRSLVYPGVPKALDSSIVGLVALERVKIVGNSDVPSEYRCGHIETWDS